jgi:hypothetical protein
LYRSAKVASQHSSAKVDRLQEAWERRAENAAPPKAGVIVNRSGQESAVHPLEVDVGKTGPLATGRTAPARSSCTDLCR